MHVANLLLNKLNSCPLNSDNLQKYFSEVAELLLNNYVISKHGVEYEIVEIEFYLFNTIHQDVITYPRNLSAGQWFFHPSGVDITFATIGNQFGGILIRGLKRITPRIAGDNRPTLILGPQKCVDELWDIFDAFGENGKTYPTLLRSKITQDTNIESYPRWIPLNKKGKDTEKAKSLRIDATIKRNNKYINDNPYLGLHGIYDDIDRNHATEIMFESKYRFIKWASINKDSNDWKKYTSKPKGS